MLIVFHIEDSRECELTRNRGRLRPAWACESSIVIIHCFRRTYTYNHDTMVTVENCDIHERLCIMYMGCDTYLCTKPTKACEWHYQVSWRIGNQSKGISRSITAQVSQAV